MAVHAVAEVEHIILARAQIAEQRRADREAIGIRDDPRIAVDVPGRGNLAGEADEREILPIKVRGQDPVPPQRRGDVVQPGIGFLLDPPERGQIELDAVVVAVAEQAHAELVVVEQETAEVRLERLDAHAQADEIEPLRIEPADVIINEGFLQADEAIGALGALRGFDIEHAPFGHFDMVDIARNRDAVFDDRRLERGFTLEQREPGDESLRENKAMAAAESVVGIGVGRRLVADGYGKAARLDHRVRNPVGHEKPVVALEEAGLLARRQRLVTLQRVVVEGIELRMADVRQLGIERVERGIDLAGRGVLLRAERGHDAPAIGDAGIDDQIGRRALTVPLVVEGFGRRRVDRAGIVLLDLVGQRLLVARAAAAIDQRLICGSGVDSRSRCCCTFRGRLRWRSPRSIDSGRRHGRRRSGMRWPGQAKQRGKKGGGDAHSPSHTFCADVSRNGANGQLM